MNLSTKNWISVVHDQVTVTPYKQILQDLVNEMKFIYGNRNGEGEFEIPIYSGEYIFLSNLSLAIWNTCLNIKNVYKQHSLDFAEGVYLDKIMALYGKTRKKERTYVIDLYLHFEGEIDYNEVILQSAKYPEATFKILRELEKHDGWGRFLIYAQDFYPFLGTQDFVDLLELNSINKNISSFRKSTLHYPDAKTKYKKDYYELLTQNIVSPQAREESDLSLKSRVTNNLNSMFNDDLLKNKYVRTFFVVGPQEEYLLNRGEEKLNAGEIKIFIEFHEEYDLLQVDEKNTVTDEILSIISENTPIGFKYIQHYNPTDKSTTTEIKKSPLTDIITQEIIYTKVNLPNGALEFTVNNVAKENLDNDIQDFINQYNQLPILGPPDYIKTLGLLNRYFNVENNRIRFTQTNYWQPIILSYFPPNETVDSSDPMYYTNRLNYKNSVQLWIDPKKTTAMADTDRILELVDLLTYTNPSPWRAKLKYYVYKQSSDGSYTVVIWGGTNGKFTDWS